MMTPIDIQNHTLKKNLGGYAVRETDEFVATVRENYEMLYKENGDLKKKITTLSEGLQYYKQMETTLQQTLSGAEKAARETLERSKTAASMVQKQTKEKADEMLAKAKGRADALVEDAKTKAEAMTAEAETNAAAMTREAEEKSERMTTEAQTNADRVTKEAELRADRLTRDAQDEAEALSHESREKARRITHEAEDKAERLVSEAEQRAASIDKNANERADRIMSETKAAAEKLIQETELTAQERLTESHEKISETNIVLKRLMNCYEDYRKQFAALLNKQLQQLEEESYQINVEEMDSLLESQVMKDNESDVYSKEQLSKMRENIAVLDEPVEADSIRPTEMPRDAFSSREESDSSLHHDIMQGGLSSENDSSEIVFTESEPASLNIDTPFSEKIGAGQGIQVKDEDAVAYKPPTDDEEEKSENDKTADFSQSINSEIDALAADALNSINSAFTDSGDMLGTSYDDYVPPKKPEDSEGESADIEKEITPTKTDELPTVQESYDHDNYVTNETYFGSADNMTYSIPDPSSSAEQNITAEPVDSEDASSSIATGPHNIPMPDFSKLDAQLDNKGDAETIVPHNIPMPDFSMLEAIAKEADAVLESSDVDDSEADAFAGISGTDPSGNGLIPPAPTELNSEMEDSTAYTAPDISGSEGASPFKFFDADQ